MRQITFNLKNYTPLLLHGADAVNDVELRPPSMRGLMRYWFRASLGGAIGDKSITSLYDLESKLFGNTNGSGAISTKIRVTNQEKGKVSLLPHKSGPIRYAFKECSFDVILSAPRPISDQLWQAGINSLLLAITLGGLGQRSRRGYGSLAIQSVSQPNVKYFNPSKYTEIENQLQTIIQGVMDNAIELAKSENIQPVDLPTGIPAFPCASKVAKIWLGPEDKGTPIDRIKDFMSRINELPELGGGNPRHASPLWVKSIPLSSNSSALLMTFLPSKSCCKLDTKSLDNVEKALSVYKGKSISIKGWNI
jgi:CRISPR type III-B/RAMP module RAMP protein Cmr1